MLDSFVKFLFSPSGFAVVYTFMAIFSVILWIVLCNNKPAKWKSKFPCNGCIHQISDFEKNVFGPWCDLSNKSVCSPPDYKHFQRTKRG